MTEPTITCPKCKTVIKLTESLAAPLIESTRREFEKQLAQKDAEVVKQETSLREREEALEKEKETIEEQVAEKLKQERVKIAAEEGKKAKLALGNDLEQKSKELCDLQEILKLRDEKLAEAQKEQAILIRKQRELDDARRELELTVEKRVQDGLGSAREQAQKEAEEKLNLKVMEKEQTITSMQKQIEELKRRAEQGSQQLQGEVQELVLEDLLKTIRMILLSPSLKVNTAVTYCIESVGHWGSPAAQSYGNLNAQRTGVTDGFQNCVMTSELPRQKSQ